VDVTQLQALSAFLGSADVPAGAYSSLSLTFANPKLVILNTSDQAITSTCAIGSVCQLTPTLDNSATVNLSGAPFPVTVSANSPLGFLIDFRLNTIIQPDLSVNLAAANGVTLSQVPPASPSQPPPFGVFTGTVQSVSASQNQFAVQTLAGQTFTIDTNSSTVLADWPPCASPGGLSCLSAGTVVQVQVASVVSAGTLLAAQVTWLQASGQQTVVGTVVGIHTSTTSPTNQTVLQLILHATPTSDANLPLGGEASVAIASGAAFSIDTNGFTISSGFVFNGITCLGVGQTVQVNVASGSLTPPANPGPSSGWGPPPLLSFTTNDIQLEPSQITGTVLYLGSGAFTLSILPDIFSGPPPPSALPLPESIVETTAQTTFQGLSPDSFSGLALGDTVSVSGWVFPQNGILDPAVGPPIVVAQAVALHPGGMF
jgi:hypothetical protein